MTFTCDGLPVVGPFLDDHESLAAVALAPSAQALPACRQGGC